MRIRLPRRSCAFWLLAVLTSISCAQRRALPAPFPVTGGATPVPARGIGAGFEFGDGVRGQELRRTEIASLGLSVGFADAVSGSINAYGETGDDGESGTFVRIKTRLASPVGPRSSLAIHFATAWTERSVTDLQDEKLRVYDLAVPLEFVIERGDLPELISWYLAPRVTIVDYDDLFDPRESLSPVMPGALGGVHLELGVFHIFGEATIVYVPQNTYLGVSYGGHLMFVPAIGIKVHTGASYASEGAREP